MRHALVTAVCASLACAASARVESQSPNRPAEGDAHRDNVRKIAESLKPGDRADPDPLIPNGWRPTKTVWGDPDIEGVYTNIDEWGVPFERPAEFEGRQLESITSAELARLRVERRDAFLERLATGEPAEPGTIGWYDNLNTTASRAWLIVDPPDGRIPAFTVAGQARAKADADRQSRPRGTDSYADQGTYARCISRGFPGSMIPEAYGNAYEIHQSPQYVAIRYEQIHETRVIPLDGRPHVGSAVQSYMGDARGRWDGNTLIVETTNFKEHLTFYPGALRVAFRGAESSTLRLIERFTALSPRKVRWSVTVDDATTWTRPWTFAMNLTRADRSQQPYEYACHEGNYGLRNILGTARALEERERR
ncbi:MAG TPA: hypothetical protein VFB92_15205 [Vicinamibacterales bacterium]|nr:hypothetical protein [Vicinamibacterales bacterium]